MEPIEKLDALLHTMEKRYPKENTFMKGVWLKFLLGDFPELSTDEVLESEMHFILEKLNRDGYVNVNTRSGSLSGEMPFYTINFEGVYFIKYAGGYKGLQTRLNAENTRVAAVERHQRRNDVILTYLTIIIALGTLFQAAYAIMQSVDWMSTRYWCK